jgi:hypothetical protein
LLAQIRHWIKIRIEGFKSDMSEEPQSITAAVDDSCVFWINGSAGTGKTTIASTIAEACYRSNILGASFFCSRDDAECSNPHLIFTTIAHQLGMYNSLFRDQVAEVLRSHPDIGFADLSFQLEELIVNPSQCNKGFGCCTTNIKSWLLECLFIHNADFNFKSAGSVAADMTSLLNDCSHFIHEFISVISISTLQIYCSGLSFTHCFIKSIQRYYLFQ